MSWSLIAIAVLTAFVLGWVVGRGNGTVRALSSPPPVRALAEVGPAVRREIEIAIAAGRKIEAIKLLREATGMGLKESKEAVEAMERG